MGRPILESPFLGVNKVETLLPLPGQAQADRPLHLPACLDQSPLGGQDRGSAGNEVIHYPQPAPGCRSRLANHPECAFEIQRVPDVLMNEISELGLTNLMMHCRPEPIPLPETLNPLKAKELAHEEMGRIILRAHEALVDADPTNADRFAAVLLALHQEIDQAASHAS